MGKRVGEEIAWAVERLVERTDISLPDTKLLTGLVLNTAYIHDFSGKPRFAYEDVVKFINQLKKLVEKYGYVCKDCKQPGFYFGNFCAHCYQRNSHTD